MADNKKTGIFDWTPAEPSKLFYQSGSRRPMFAWSLGVHVWTTDGARYIDASSGAMVSNIGHSNPRVIAAMRAQMETGTFAYRMHFESEPAERLATAIGRLCPPGLTRVFFASGGSEAVESAIKLARQYKLAKGEASRTEVISRFPAYHGSTFGTLAVTGYNPLTRPFAPMYRDMPKIPAPRAYLDRDNLTDDEKGNKYAEALRQKIEEIGPKRALAFIMEPVGGASTGALVAPDNYYQRIRDICDEYGLLLIYDEVMTGVGRTGKFLAAEHWGQSPDIVVLGKGLGAGYAPLSAVVSRADIVEAVLADGGFMHGYTYAGNPLACSAGLAVLKEIMDQDLIGNASLKGDILKSRLAALMERFPFIGDVRGKGLLLAFELVGDRSTMAPLPKAMNAFHNLVEIAFAEKLVIYARRTRGGDEGDHFLVCPPMIVTDDDLDEIMDKLTRSLATFARETGLPDREG